MVNFQATVLKRLSCEQMQSQRINIHLQTVALITDNVRGMTEEVASTLFSQWLRSRTD